MLVDVAFQRESWLHGGKLRELEGTEERVFAVECRRLRHGVPGKSSRRAECGEHAFGFLDQSTMAGVPGVRCAVWTRLRKSLAAVSHAKLVLTMCDGEVEKDTVTSSDVSYGEARDRVELIVSRACHVAEGTEERVLRCTRRVCRSAKRLRGQHLANLTAFGGAVRYSGAVHEGRARVHGARRHAQRWLGLLRCVEFLQQSVLCQYPSWRRRVGRQLCCHITRVKDE